MAVQEKPENNEYLTIFANITDKKTETKESELYKSFIKYYSKYVSWANTSNIGKSYIEKIKSKIHEKIREVELYAAKNATKIKIIVNQNCFKCDKIPNIYKLPYISDNYNIALSGLIIYTVIAKFEKVLKKYIKYIKKIGLVLEFDGILTYTKPATSDSPAQTATASGLYFSSQHKISFGVFYKIYQWYATQKDILGTFEHEFGHYLDNIKSVHAKRSTKLKEHYEKLIKSIQDTQVKSLAKDIIMQIDSIAISDSDKTKAEWFITLLNESIQKFNDNLVNYSSRKCAMSQAALVKMYNWITTNTNVKPTQGASKYVETYLKNSLDPEDLSTATNNRYWEENFADARRKSKIPIFQEIKSKLGNKLKNDNDWKNLCALANSKTSDKDKVKLAETFVLKLTSGRRVWGLAYRVLQLDKVNLIDLLKDIPIDKYISKSCSVILIKNLKEMQNRISNLKNINNFVNSDGEIIDDKLEKCLDCISTFLDN